MDAEVKPSTLRKPSVIALNWPLEVGTLEYAIGDRLTVLRPRRKRKRASSESASGVEIVGQAAVETLPLDAQEQPEAAKQRRVPRQRVRFAKSQTTVHIEAKWSIPFVDDWLRSRRVSALASEASARLGETLEERSGRKDAVVMVCRRTWEYHRAAKSQVLPGDAVLEIGTDFGQCTRHLVKIAGNLGGTVGVVVSCDKNEEHLRQAETSLRDAVERSEAVLQTQAGDVLVNDCALLSTLWEQMLSERQQRCAPESRCLLFIDVNGNRELDAVLCLLQKALSWTDSPDLLVVKSESLADFLAKPVPVRTVVRRGKETHENV